MPRVRVPVANAPGKVVLVEPEATRGSQIGVNLYDADGNLLDAQALAVLLAPYFTTTTSSGPVTTSSGGTAAAAGSNSGYNPLASPAAAPTNFDIDLSMIAGLGKTAFPTLNYILVGDGTQWLAVPMSGDASIVASGALTLAAGQRRYRGTASGTDTYTVTTSPTHAAYAAGDLLTITFTNANTGAATLNANTLGPLAIQQNGAALTGGEIPAGSTLELLYDGTQFQIVGGGGSSSPNDYAALEHMAFGGI